MPFSGEPTKGGGAGQQISPSMFGHYVVLKQLGAGGMGTVYLVRNPKENRLEALKVIRLTGTSADEDLTERFRREASVSFDHPNLPKVYEAGVMDGVQFFTMRYLDGKLLSAFGGSPHPLVRAVKIATKLAQALTHAHACGVSHRDLKPGNVMMCQGEGPVVMDFGLVKWDAVSDSLTRTGAMLGTPAYMPPEQVRGDKRRMGPASDIYSLGVILYEMLTGQLPFRGEGGEVFAKILYEPPVAPSLLRPGIDPALDAICGRAMAKAAEDRYDSMASFASALHAVLKRLDGGEESVAVKKKAAPPPPPSVFAKATVLPGRVAGVILDAEPAPDDTLQVASNLSTTGPRTKPPPPPRSKQPERRPPWIAAAVAVTLGVVVAGAILAVAAMRSQNNARRAEDEARDKKAKAERDEQERIAAEARAKEAAFRAAVLADFTEMERVTLGGTDPGGMKYLREKAPTRLPEWRRAAESGIPQGQHLLGRCYYGGHEVPVDLQESFRWVELAANQRLAASQNFLGARYIDGKGTARNLDKGIGLIRLSAEQGYAIALDNLGYEYQQGEYVPKDMTLAAGYYRQAADKGYAAAQYTTGHYLHFGKGVAENKTEAVRYFRLSADQGYSLGQSMLGYCYEEGKGIDKDIHQAIRYYRLAVEQNNPVAQSNLGLCYMYGKGINPADPVEAVRLFHLAAKQNDAFAQYELGRAYRYGIGVKTNETEAVMWLKRSADQGNEMAKKEQARKP